jgi:hypothetical protein
LNLPTYNSPAIKPSKTHLGVFEDVGSLKIAYIGNDDNLWNSPIFEDGFPFFPLHCQTSHQRPGILAISGSEARTRRRFAAPSGRQITGMQFDNHQLMGVFLENLGLDLEKMYR